jgi:Leucine-rich repeat (LRR) protein
LRSRPLSRLTVGLLSLCVFAACLHEVNARRQSDAAASQEAGAFDSLEKALRSPEKVRRLVLQGEDPALKHLPAGLGTLVNLEALELACLENLEDLPEEIGRLRKLRELIIDNGNGCSMNVSLPRSVGRLEGLRVLRLYGALDGREVGTEDSARSTRTKLLPDSLAELQNLEELDLGRNGIRSVPPQVASLRGLKKLSLDYNDIREVPSFVGELKNLRELSINANGGTRLPQTLSGLKGLKVFMGNNRLTLGAQKSLRARFPNAVFNFENEYDDDAANQEPPKPRARRRK